LNIPPHDDIMIIYFKQFKQHFFKWKRL